jgi:adenylosuccinate synthase
VDSPRATVVVGLGFGDEGKGSIVDYLVRRDDTVGTVVRFNGGPQAAHRVVAPDGREHVFAQFGSGTLVPGVHTYLARGMLVNPANLMVENEGLRRIGVRDALARLAVDPECVIVTGFHIAANRALEDARGTGRHGSCGQGVGEARHDELAGVAVRAGDCVRRATLIPVLRRLQEINRAKIEGLDGDDIPAVRRWLLGDEAALFQMADLLTDPRWLGCVGRWTLPQRVRNGNLVFEGAQGVLLDETHGFQPHTTWTDTTALGAVAILDELGLVPYSHIIGVTRAYSTRHGAGPFPTYDEGLTAALPDPENGDGRWQGPFRSGWLDVPLLRYAVQVCPVDAVAVTCLDRAAVVEAEQGDWWVCSAYDLDDAGTVPVRVLPSHDALVNGYSNADRVARAKPLLTPLAATAEAYNAVLGAMVGADVEIASYGPTALHKAELERVA